MKFPGKRKSKHYFPVTEKGRIPFQGDFTQRGDAYIVGIDQLLVDIEIHVSDEFMKEHGLEKGQSFILDDRFAEELYQRVKHDGLVVGEFAGGAIGNTIHNYSILSDDNSVLMGAISRNITVGDYAFRYLCNTSTKVDLSYLQPVDGPMGRAMCFVTPDGERSFGISKGKMNSLSSEFIPEDVIARANALLITAFLLRSDKDDIYHATMKAVKIANEHNVPVVCTLGTSSLISEKRDFFTKFIRDHVTVLAMNDQESEALTLQSDPLLAGERALELADLVLITVGERGLYLAGYVDEQFARVTSNELHSKAIPEYNKYEFSRPMRKKDCLAPLKIYSHINPYMGGPGRIQNTNGAGDAALAALLHDMSANCYHRTVVPNSPKHKADYLTYSSLSQNCKYANRVSFEVLIQNSPRLARSLPQREDSLEESYWEL